jgi:TetR/AcrR family transcriptional regulator, transcriptional repressor for nem operon
MVQNQAKAGRPLAFEHEAALEAAMDLFWERGYDGTGLSQLEVRTGLNRSSLYNSFGPKHALFAAALEFYTRQLAGRMFATLESGNEGLKDLSSFLEQLARHHAANAGRGCFMANTMAGAPDEVAAWPELATAYIEHFLSAARAVLRRAATRGEIAEAEIDSGSQLLLSVVLGATLLARARQPQRLIEATLTSAFNHIANGPRGRPGAKPAAVPPAPRRRKSRRSR